MTMIGLWIFKENENANKSEIKKILNSQSRLIPKRNISENDFMKSFFISDVWFRKKIAKTLSESFPKYIIFIIIIVTIRSIIMLYIYIYVKKICFSQKF